MSALAKLKKTAAQHEQDRQYDKALAQYARLLDGDAGSDEEVDVTLYNRAGDLALRAGDMSRAVTYFERAIDLYAAGGFLNNAVALAVKILRHAPGHLAAHHTLGLLYARKGFRAEARQHLAEYAAQMHRAGRDEEVGRTLAELAALGSTADEAAAARELLTTRAAGPEAAGALVKLFDASVGPARVDASDAHPAVPMRGPANLSLSELLEREVRGEDPAVADTHASPALRWLTALPDERPPLRLATLRGAVPIDVGASEPDRFALDPWTPTGGVAAEDVELGFEEFAAPLALDANADHFLSADDLSRYEIAGPERIDHGPAALDALGTLGALDTPDAGFDVLDLTTPGSPPADLERPTPASTAREFAPALSLLDAFEVPTAAASAPAADARETRPGLELARPGDDASTDLGEWLRSTELPASTRLVTGAPRETGDQDADFGAALDAFKAGIAQSVDADDRESHYDLGVAFREMGLLSDAVREFQRAAGAPGGGLREREALAQCFLDLGRSELALATLEHAAAAAAAAGQSGEMLLGVHYVLAESARAIGRTDDARDWYVRVLATDYGFRDAATRLAALPPPQAAALTR